MKGDKLILITYLMLESIIGTYIEWLANELMMSANTIEYKDARLVMITAVAINPQAR
jgi:hypothetical protein